MPVEPRKIHVRVREVTERIRERSRSGRADYLARMEAARQRGSARAGLSCTNLAHGFAASDAADKEALKLMRWPNVAIVSAYNDMLSAHQPLERYPALIKRAAREAGAVAQFAGGVPAMCDGVTQGQPGHGVVAVQSRRDRDGHRGRAGAQHVRLGTVSRRLRQNRSRHAHGRAGVRSLARDLRPRRPDALRRAQQGEGADPPALRRGQGRPRRSCSNRRPAVITPRARALFTARPTAIRC